MIKNRKKVNWVVPKNIKVEKELSLRDLFKKDEGKLILIEAEPDLEDLKLDEGEKLDLDMLNPIELARLTKVHLDYVEVTMYARESREGFSPKCLNLNEFSQEELEEFEDNSQILKFVKNIPIIFFDYELYDENEGIIHGELNCGKLYEDMENLYKFRQKMIEGFNKKPKSYY